MHVPVQLMTSADHWPFGPHVIASSSRPGTKPSAQLKVKLLPYGYDVVRSTFCCWPRKLLETYSVALTSTVRSAGWQLLWQRG